VDGVRYVQAALAYPRERKARGKSLAVGNAPMELLQLYDAASDAFAPQQSAQWSDWYQTHAREPTNMELASYVQPQYAAQVAQWKAKQVSPSLESQRIAVSEAQQLTEMLGHHRRRRPVRRPRTPLWISPSPLPPSHRACRR